MHKGRLEAFSDGVLAIVITIMVLELKVPHGADPEDLRALWPVLLSYLMSFIYIGIYWNNHHHLMQAVHRVNGPVLWANLHLLFWLSLVPFATAWMGENHFAPWPVALYGGVLLAAACAYFILTRALLSVEGCSSRLAMALGRDRKGKFSVALYALAIPLTQRSAWLACAIYAAVALIWLLPDRRIERVLGEG